MVTAEGSVTIRAEPLHAWIHDVLRASGVPEEDATNIADGMVWAELHAVDLGTRRVPTVVNAIKGGGTKAAPQRKVVSDRPTFAVLDADQSWGVAASVQAMRIAISKARAHGVGACVVRNTGNSLGMGYYPSLAIEERLIGLAFTNALPLQAPWGGTKKTLGNQAHAIGVPAGRHAPLLFDSATTAITWASIHEFVARGERLPEGLAVDTEGKPTTDPEAAIAGRLLPMGGHRGFGIALMWEVLTGVLSGGEMFGATVSGGFPDRASGQSTFLMAIDPTVAMPYETFVARVDDLIDQVHASPPAPGVERIYVPGERSAEVAKQRAQGGIPLSAARMKELMAVAESTGVRFPS